MMFSEQERTARLRLAKSLNVGPSTFVKLTSKYGSANSAIKYLSNHKSKYSEGICSLNNAADELRQIEKLGGQLIFLGESLYPNALAMIADPPPTISVLGNCQMIERLPSLNLFAVVGSRACSYNSARFAYNLSQDLSAADVTVVSGLARGIDTQAHRGGLASKGSSIAVLACGLDMPPYPPENKDLYFQLREQGLIVSEMPLGAAPQATLFPRRNRIIAGLARGTLVVEAADRSGSLTTARYALEYNRDVYAVPGFPLDPRCVGTNRLLKNGATLVESAADILSNYPNLIRSSLPSDILEFEEPISVWNFPETNNTAVQATDLGQVDNKSKILSILGANSIAVEDLVCECCVPANELMATLTELELDNKVKIENGQQVSLIM
ncbi:MAG: DNA-processing protein DprA [Holosporales bacterium]|jgi:DNA processing protein|nr:DNA-processing protein DprA [Holosporales bacterium]